MQNKICTVHNNLYLRKLLDFKIYLDMKPSGTMAYLFNKRFSVGPWGRVLKEGGTEVYTELIRQSFGGVGTFFLRAINRKPPEDYEEGE